MSSQTLHLIINNVAKRVNIRELCTSALAHGFHVMLCGHLDIAALSLEKLQGQGLQVSHFWTLKECKQHCEENDIVVTGIEIMESAVSILDDPPFYKQNIAFMPGNEGRGMSEAQKAICDHFVYIPQYGNGTASLNVNVATALVLHNFVESRFNQLQNGRGESDQESKEPSDQSTASTMREEI
mmetsp:Transcript_27047/g.45685  ORF Transcript_27047/g.45685 Transcript_27047/m.45685 type:complete len:183 (+) Transcript_27047:130-678(+)